MDEHVHDLAYVGGEEPDILCLDTYCGKQWTPTEVFKMLNAAEQLKRMSNEDVAAELSATFDLSLDLTRKIAYWIMKPFEGE